MSPRASTVSDALLAEFRTAGWSVPSIAREVGLSVRQVQARLRALGLAGAAGRPQGARAGWLRVRMSAEELGELQTRAEAAGLSVAAFVRARCLGAE